MGQPLTLPPPGFDQLSVEEQIEYVQALWNRIIAATPEQIPVPKWHLEALDKRLAEADAEPQDSVPWEAVQTQLQTILKRGA